MFSIIAPMDINRLEQFKVTKRLYDLMPQEKEFIIPSRSAKEVKEYLRKYRLSKDTAVIPYEHEIGFNPSKAFNIGVRNAIYDNIIITSPEVKPVGDVLHQLEGFIGQNIVCRVEDEAPDGNLSVLIEKGFRDKTPAMYFLAMFQRKDIEAINGWDEDFMLGYAYEDNDFGDRWVRAGLPFKVINEIRAIHQYHPRTETIKNGMATNFNKYNENTDNGVIKCHNGLFVI